MPEAIIPIFHALIAAAFFGGQVVLSTRSFAYVDTQIASMISMGTVVLIFWSMAPFMLQADYFRNPGMWIFIGNGLMHPLISLYLSYEAVKRMGPTIAATISAIAPLFATAGALLMLGENITLELLLGTIATVVGIMVLSWNRQGAFDWSLSALVFPIGTALIRGAIHTIGKFGLKLLPIPYFAGLVSFTVSFIGAVITYCCRFGYLPLKLPRGGLMWSGLAGVSISIGAFSFYSALNSGNVVVVSPILSTSPLFTLLISLLFRQEVLNFRLLTGVIIVVAGVIWISVQ